MGKVEAAFSDSFIVKLEKQKNMEIKYEIPRLELSGLIDDRIIFELKQIEIDEKYQKSSIKKSSEQLEKNIVAYPASTKNKILCLIDWILNIAPVQ
jgi:hypothetical protein